MVSISYDTGKHVLCYQAESLKDEFDELDEKHKCLHSDYKEKCRVSYSSLPFIIDLYFDIYIRIDISYRYPPIDCRTRWSIRFPPVAGRLSASRHRQDEAREAAAAGVRPAEGHHSEGEPTVTAARFDRESTISTLG